MDYSDKIKAIQQGAGVEADGVATSKTWIAIYHALFSSVPYNLNIDSIIKSVQEKLGIRVTGFATARTWNALLQYFLAHKALLNDHCIDAHNEIMLQNMTKEVVPFAKELVRLAATSGIHVKIISAGQEDSLQHLPEARHEVSCNHDFGLVFNIGIFEKASNGEYVYLAQSPSYATVAKLGESIGLTWTGEKKTFTSKPIFELRPAWAVRMKEMEMIQELCRRKKENINLLAIL